MLDLGGFFHHTCVLRHNLFWSSAINLGLTVTTKRQRSRGGVRSVQDGRQYGAELRPSRLETLQLIPIKPPHWPKRQGRLILTRIERDPGRHLVRVFDCPRSEYVPKLLIEYPQNVGAGGQQDLGSQRSQEGSR
jgi:hypothetical protein